MSRRRLVAVAAVAALLVGGGLAMRALGRDQAAAGAPPTAPPGSRLVGVGGVVVAVPDSWIDYQAVCSTPAAPYVEFEPLAVEFCGADFDPYDSARQMRLDPVQAERLAGGPGADAGPRLPSASPRMVPGGMAGGR